MCGWAESAQPRARLHVCRQRLHGLAETVLPGLSARQDNQRAYSPGIYWDPSPVRLKRPNFFHWDFTEKVS